MTRRQFGAGAAAIAAAAATPLPAFAQPRAVRAAPIVYPAFISQLDGEWAKAARRMVRLDSLFSYTDAHYFTDERCEGRWSPYYGEMVECAEWAFDPPHDPPTEAEQAFAAWARKRIPTANDLRQEPWPPIEGLSPPFRRRQIVLQECLMRYALAAMAFDFVTYDRLQNTFHPEHDEIDDAYRRARDRLRKVVNGDAKCSGPWGWPTPRTPSDLLLLRRVWLIWKDADEVFRTKFLPQALEQLQERGITWTATDDGQGNRTWVWVRSEARPSASIAIPL
jgi:hypothetical protein